jgi:MFS family permease
MSTPPLSRLLIPRLPFYYGWVILGCVCLAGFARQGPAVAVLSIFIEPMRQNLGWPSTAFGGAVALGGVLAAIVSPAVGRMLDRHGARSVLCFAVVSTGLATMAISRIDSLLLFYVLFCFARMNWAGPFDLGCTAH